MNKFKKSQRSKVKCQVSRRRGQMMLVTVIILSSAILGVTALAGVLTLYQVRNTGDVINSTKAIFAADAGVECVLYKTQKDLTQDCGEAYIATNDQSDAFNLDNGAFFYVNLLSDGTVLQSTGISARTARAFELTFTE